MIFRILLWLLLVGGACPQPLPHLQNFRDFGGYPTADGQRVRRGVLYRSGQLFSLKPEDRQALQGLGLHQVFDFRTEGERNLRPDEVPPGARSVVVDVRAQDKGASLTEQQEALFRDPAAAQALLGEGRGRDHMLRRYRQYVSSPAAIQAYRELCLGILKSDGLPSLYHCSAGKDRTGWASAALLSLLGVAPEVVMEDYLRSNEGLREKYGAQLEDFQARGGDPEIWLAVLEVRPEYLEAALDEMRSKFGNIEGYFSQGLGLGPREQQELRQRLLEREED